MLERKADFIGTLPYEWLEAGARERGWERAVEELAKAATVALVRALNETRNPEHFIN